MALKFRRKKNGNISKESARRFTSARIAERSGTGKGEKEKIEREGMNIFI